MCMLGAFSRINTSFLFPARLDSVRRRWLSAAFLLELHSLRSAEPKIWLTAPRFACSGFLQLCCRREQLVPIQVQPFWHFPYPDNSITVRKRQCTKADCRPRQCFTLPQKDENTGQMQTPDLHLALKSCFAVIPALAVLPYVVVMGPFNASASVSSISKPETIFTRRCKTRLAFVKWELLSMLLWICRLIHTKTRYFIHKSLIRISL